MTGLMTVFLILSAPLRADEPPTLIEVGGVQEGQQAAPKEGLTEADRAKLAAIVRDVKEDKNYTRNDEYDAEERERRQAEGTHKMGTRYFKPQADIYLDLADARAAVSNPRLEGELRIPKAAKAELKEFIDPKYWKHGLFLVSWMFQRLGEFDLYLKRNGQFAHADMRSLLAIGKFLRVNSDVWVYTDGRTRVTIKSLFESTMSSIHSSAFVRMDMASRVVPKDFKNLKNRWTEDDKEMIKIYGREKYKFILSPEGEGVSPLLAWGRSIAMTATTELRWGEADGLGLYDPQAFRGKIPERFRSDPRYIVAWLSLHANLPGSDSQISTADYGITLMEIATFAYENRHLIVARPPEMKGPIKVWHIFMNPQERIGEILCNWKMMILAFSMKPGGPTAGGPLGVLAELAGSMNNMRDITNATVTGSKLCPTEPPK